jgi:gluconate 2-dehydrogenase gamma chain
MKTRSHLSRRRFIQIAGAAVAAGSTLSCRNNSSRWRFLTDEEARTLAALCDQIIPEDQDPGAASAGVVNYIDVQLYGFLKNHRNRYRQGLVDLDKTTVMRYEKKFADLRADTQRDFLVSLDRDPVWNGTPLKRFFDLVITHTMQGFYGDPRHGGNRDRVSWKMVGLPYPPARGRIRYDLNAPPSAAKS